MAIEDLKGTEEAMKSAGRELWQTLIKVELNFIEHNVTWTKTALIRDLLQLRVFKRDLDDKEVLCCFESRMMTKILLEDNGADYFKMYVSVVLF